MPDPQRTDPLRNLRALRHKVDHHGDRVMMAHARHFACRSGCDGCCQTERSVTDVEYAALEVAVDRLPAETLDRLRAQRPTQHCSLLLDGRCSVYEERPIICRSHGLPLLIEEQLDVCPLNFTEGDVAELPVEDVLSVGTVTAILVTLNQLYCHETDSETGRRRDVGTLLQERAPDN